MKNILGKKADYVSPELDCIFNFMEDALMASAPVGNVGDENFDNDGPTINFGW